MEEVGGEPFSPPSPHQGGDTGKELLRHLLRDKTSPANTPSPTAQAPPMARRQLSSDSIRSEEDDTLGSHGNMVKRWPGQTNAMSCNPFSYFKFLKSFSDMNPYLTMITCSSSR